ncbi:S8 family peptidase [Sphingomonas sp. PAMC 26605]|uniref:S8 family peptidase n=1 Tax=Sphingomonas sp. PAMC 26605 TaxID=1112214 RepID=UPI00026CB58B|nr:S8 family serine peptidase [Sphingomonas sp. PAMC 26605]
MIRALIAIAVALCAVPVMAQAPTPTAPVTVSDSSPERRILVMLELPPEHYRPSADYGGGSGGYGDPAAARARRRLAERLARDNGLTVLDTWPMPTLGIDCVIMTVPGTTPLADVSEHMSHLKGVAWSQPMNHFETQAAQARAPNDPLFAAQPAAHNWQLADLHRMATGLRVKIGIVDSQIDTGHPDLRGQLISSQNFVGAASGPETHGTGVAGIIGARENNSVGIAGVAPGARLIGLRACWQRTAGGTVCDSLSLARALDYAIGNGVDIVNMSLTGPQDLLLTRLIQLGMRRGMSVVAAIDPRTGEGFPASIPGVVAVAELGVAASRHGVYNAPGRDVPTTQPGGRWYLVSGNSYAAAHVSGLLALARELNARGGRQLASTDAGSGSIDACATLLLASGGKGGGCRVAR